MGFVVVYKENDDIYMGCDSIEIVDTNKYVTLDNPRIFIKDNMLFGFSGLLKISQIIEYDFNIPKHPTNLSDMEYLVSIFIEQLLETIENKRYLCLGDESIFIEEGSFLLAYNSNFYTITNSFQIHKNNKNYNCIGIGDSIGNGVFFGLETIPMDPIYRIEKVMDGIGTFSICSKPFKILKLSNDKKKNNKIQILTKQE